MAMLSHKEDKHQNIEGNPSTWKIFAPQSIGLAALINIMLGIRITLGCAIPMRVDGLTCGEPKKVKAGNIGHACIIACRI